VPSCVDDDSEVFVLKSLYFYVFTGGYVPQLDGFKDCLVQQQFIFDRQLRLAVKQLAHFARLNAKLFSLGEYVLSPVQSAIEV